MQSGKQKVSDAAASAKEHVDVLKAKVGGQVDKTAAGTKEDKEVEANTKKHEDEAGNEALHLQGKQQAGVGTAPAHQGGQHHTGDTVPPSL